MACALLNKAGKKTLREFPVLVFFSPGTSLNMAREYRQISPNAEQQ